MVKCRRITILKLDHGSKGNNMKVTITFDMNMETDGEDTSVSFSKDHIEFEQDYFNAVGRAATAGGFCGLDWIEFGGRDRPTRGVEF